MNTGITIEPYQEKWAADFKRLNTAWLEAFFEVEPIDEQMLSNPQAYYLDKGGFIYFAVKNMEQVLGCYALIKGAPGCFELSKMAVDSSFQGNQLGHLLVQHAIDTAKGKGAGTLQLYSHSKLGAALHLYKKFGFVQIPVGDSVYKRSDIKMEKILT
ncbi:GNAT family N-acetyltransferase [Flavihumibacter sp. UBA7668]|uniref:GNAT family N-acetyltransferase n=1 Tax=Flavihumibacter sp. UBA7668 TaxID=1946542 RepID=UPI0025BC57B9|nr:GNAT family N-acetyltransferase [Flavihumibacter sp. UBA7668]